VHVNATQIWTLFGSFDRQTKDPLRPTKKIRLCNWIRFAKRLENPTDPNVNIHAKVIDGQPTLQVCKDIETGTPLTIYFHMESIPTDDENVVSEKINNDGMIKREGFSPNFCILQLIQPIHHLQDHWISQSQEWISPILGMSIN